MEDNFRNNQFYEENGKIHMLRSRNQ